MEPSLGRANGTHTQIASSNRPWTAHQSHCGSPQVLSHSKYGMETCIPLPRAAAPPLPKKKLPIGFPLPHASIIPPKQQSLHHSNTGEQHSPQISAGTPRNGCDRRHLSSMGLRRENRLPAWAEGPQADGLLGRDLGRVPPGHRPARPSSRLDDRQQRSGACGAPGPLLGPPLGLWTGGCRRLECARGASADGDARIQVMEYVSMFTIMLVRTSRLVLCRVFESVSITSLVCSWLFTGILSLLSRHIPAG